MRLLTTLALTTALIACDGRSGANDSALDSGLPSNVDSDGDGVADQDDAFPDDPTESSDLDDDGVGDNADAFPADPSESADSDEDGVGDNADAFPNDASESADTDADGVGDNADNCKNAANADQADTDEDGTGDACEGDRDSDGVIDDEDVFPDDPNESADSDSDGVGDNADAFPNDATETRDTDGDGVGDNADPFPDDDTESADTDEDGIGDNADNCPTNANAQQSDGDGDGIGDVCDPDRDGDGVDNADDAFPNDPSESADTDSDGMGDNADAFPTDPSETVDTDSDGVGDNSDNCRKISNGDQSDIDSDGAGDACDDDIDGDGADNSNDAFPNDPTETLDNDADGSGNNADCDDNDDSVFPGATEVCDGRDGDCNDTIDDGAALGMGETCPAESCLSLVTSDSGLSDGSYYLDPVGSGTSTEVYCDMTTDGGGYTYYKAPSDGSSRNAAQWEQICEAAGMQLFVPRTPEHLKAALTFAADTNLDRELTDHGTPSVQVAHLYLLGIYPSQRGNRCVNVAMTSESCTTWHASDNGPYYVSDRTNITEPNGDNAVDSSMYYSWASDLSGASWYNDINAPGYSSPYALCQVGDKWGDGLIRE